MTNAALARVPVPDATSVTGNVKLASGSANTVLGFSQRAVEWEGKPRSRLARAPDDEELVRRLDSERTNKQRIDGAEDRCRRTQT